MKFNENVCEIVKKDIVNFEELPQGAVFEWQGSLYWKINDKDKDVNSLNLNVNDLVCFSPDWQVRMKKSKLIVW